MQIYTLFGYGLGHEGLGFRGLGFWVQVMVVLVVCEEV